MELAACVTYGACRAPRTELMFADTDNATGVYLSIETYRVAVARLRDFMTVFQ